METIEDKANMELTRSGYGRVAVLQRDNLRKYEEVKHCLCLVCFHCLRVPWDLRQVSNVKCQMPSVKSADVHTFFLREVCLQSGLPTAPARPPRI